MFGCTLKYLIKKVIATCLSISKISASMQPLIPTQKVRSTSQLVEKILYVDQQKRVIMRVGINWKILV